MGSAVSTGKDNDDLVDNLILGSYIKTTQVEEVFRAVDRAYYYLPEHKDNAYHDLAWKNGNLHLSAPCVYCEVMESLELKPGLSFLNIGSGTGYFNTMVGLILGANGTNHGIEMFEDNVEYAEMKLEEFKRTSPSIDAFEFCEPQFVTGNGFCIPFGGQLYDRVYCGAAVPETHASHVQSFLKIGGILVMPYNHHLVQMKRLSVTQYDVSIVLPVSFATLRMPEDSETPQTVTLPDLASVSSLKDACRVVLRRLLRAAVETPRRQPATAAVGGDTRSRKRQLQQVIVAQLCELSDDDDDYGEVGREGLAVNCFPFRVARTVNRRNRVVAGDDGEEEEEDEGLEEERMEDEEEEEKGEEEGGEEEAAAASQSINEQRRKVAKREKFDSGLGEEIDNEKGLTSADEENEEEENSSSDDSSNERGRNEEKLRGDLMREKLKRKAIMQRLEREREKRNAERITNRNFRGDCSREMRDSIMKLPLPMELKSYLNLYRDF